MRRMGPFPAELLENCGKWLGLTLRAARSPTKNWKQNGAWRVDISRVASLEDHFNCEEWAIEKIGNQEAVAGCE